MDSVGGSGSDNISKKCTDDRTDVLRFLMIQMYVAIPL